MRLIRVLLTGAMMLAITGGGVLAGEKQKLKIDLSKAAVVFPFKSSVTGIYASLLAETTRKEVTACLKEAALFSEVLTPEEAKGKDKAMLIEITGTLNALEQTYSHVVAVFNVAITDSATGTVLWEQPIKGVVGANFVTSPVSDSERSKLPGKLAREFVRQLSFSTKTAPPKEYNHGQFYFSGAGLIIPGKLVCNDLSGVSGAGGMGVGLEMRIYKRFALSGESLPFYSTNPECLEPTTNEMDGVSLSIGASYHFAQKFDPKTGVSIPNPLDPFLTIGTSRFVLGDYKSYGQVYLGGGINYWVGSHGGFRLEFRDHALTFLDRSQTTKVPSLHFIMSAQVGVVVRF
jgi:hypothetical protein